MLNEQEVACVMIAACVCAQDGLISQAEEEVIYEELKRKYPEVDSDLFDLYMDMFFESDEQIEDYLVKVESPELRLFVLSLAEKSASVDGLDVRENIALQKALKYWRV